MPAHYDVIDGFALPARLSGHPALDFCNTWAGWNGQTPMEFLRSYEHLAVWAEFVELLPPALAGSLRREASRHKTAAAAELEQAKAFRDSLHRVLCEPGDTRAFDLVAAAVHAAAASLRLRRDEGSVRLALASEAGLTAPRLAAAWSAGQLIASAPTARVRVCARPECLWLFLDPTGRRRWCTMAICGNRAKVRRFAERKRARGERR